MGAVTVVALPKDQETATTSTAGRSDDDKPGTTFGPRTYSTALARTGAIAKSW